ncbi:hypothetical protein D3C75_1002410 [compost metagenome]
MKENSPICDRPMPTRSEVRPSLPTTKAPRLQLRILPSTTATLITAIGQACAWSTAGSISRPMVTKKMALNMWRNGSTSRSICASWRDSAMIAPLRKAPSTRL